MNTTRERERATSHVTCDIVPACVSVPFDLSLKKLCWAPTTASGCTGFQERLGQHGIRGGRGVKETVQQMSCHSREPSSKLKSRERGQSLLGSLTVPSSDILMEAKSSWNAIPSAEEGECKDITQEKVQEAQPKHSTPFFVFVPMTTLNLAHKQDRAERGAHTDTDMDTDTHAHTCKVSCGLRVHTVTENAAVHLVEKGPELLLAGDETHSTPHPRQPVHKLHQVRGATEAQYHARHQEGSV